MNLVELNFNDSDGYCVEQYFFHTYKGRSYFCSLDNEIADSFKNWLSRNHPEMNFSNNNYEVFYYHQDSIEEI